MSYETYHLDYINCPWCHQPLIDLDEVTEEKHPKYITYACLMRYCAVQPTMTFRRGCIVGEKLLDGTIV